MGISNSEHITRIGLFYSRATKVKAKMLLNIEHVIFINLYVSIKSKSIPLMVLFNFLKFYHDKVYIHLDRSNNTKHIVNYTPLHPYPEIMGSLLICISKMAVSSSQKYLQRFLKEIFCSGVRAFF